MASKPANTDQKEWMDQITLFIEDNSLGILYKGYEGKYDMQRHHVTGRSSKHNKVPIGHYFINPVPYELHEPNEKHQYHVGHCKKAFVKKYGNQRDIFINMVDIMRMQGYKTWLVPLDVLLSISDTSA